MPETDWHRDLMFLLIDVLRAFFAAQRRVYISGNLLLFYEEGNKRRHVSPDVFVVRGVENYQRPNYLLWEEGVAPQIVIELTSSTTRRSDRERKFALYQDTLRVREYFLFDPHLDYLDPQLQGYRLRQGVYHAIREVRGRVPSQVLGLHLEPLGRNLRLWDPTTKAWLPTAAERTQQEIEARANAEALAASAQLAAASAQQEAAAAQQARESAEQRAAKLEAEIERLRKQLAPGASDV